MAYMSGIIHGIFSHSSEAGSHVCDAGSHMSGSHFVALVIWSVIVMSVDDL